MNRRSNESRGFVNFPTNDPTWRNTGEGGMFVLLVVAQKAEDESWMLCCGGSSPYLMNESFIGDDVHPRPSIQDYERLISENPFPDGNASQEDFQCHAALINKATHGPAEGFHFPRLYEAPNPATRYGGLERYMSIAYLAVVNLGSTGWSGWSDEREETWLCTYNDLTEDGKNVYDNLKKLYGDSCQLFLQTWLDT